MSEETQAMIGHILSKDYTKAQASFDEIISGKMADALDQRKVEIAGQIFNGMESTQVDEEDELLDD